MKVGGVRRLIVPVELGYPGQPPDFTKLGPAPGNFSVRLDMALQPASLAVHDAADMDATWKLPA